MTTFLWILNLQRCSDSRILLAEGDSNMKTYRCLAAGAVLFFLCAVFASAGYAAASIDPQFEGTLVITSPDGEINLIEPGDAVPAIVNDSIIEVFDGKFKVIGSDLPDNIEVEVHFEEIQKQIIEQIKLAKFTIWVAVAWFTDKELMRELYNQKQNGINVRLVVLDDEINSKNGFEYEKYFETKRVPKSGIYQNIMHHKFCIIDLKTIVHGSYNWTTKAKWNRETISIENSRELAEKYATEFQQLIK